MKKLITVLFCAISMFAPHLSVQAKTTGYNGECRSSSKWKQVKQYHFSAKSKSYELIESHKSDSKNPQFSYVSFCLSQGSSLKILNIFKNERSVSLSSTGNIYDFKKIENSVFTFKFIYDADVANIMLYKIDMRNPQTPKVTLLKTSYG